MLAKLSINVGVYWACAIIGPGYVAMKFWCTGAVPPGVLSCNSKVLFKRSLVIISSETGFKHLCLISENMPKTTAVVECTEAQDITSSKGSTGGY